MPAYLVTLPRKGGMTLIGDNDSVIVWATDEAQAKSLASAAIANDVPAAAWADAAVLPLQANTELEGWVYTIVLSDPETPFTEISVSVTVQNAQTVDDAGAALATALNATAINGAAYNSSTNELKIVETTDGMGDWLIDAYVTPPGALTNTSLGFGDTSARVTGFFGPVTAPGASGIARVTTLAVTAPALYAMVKVGGDPLEPQMGL